MSNEIVPDSAQKVRLTKTFNEVCTGEGLAKEEFDQIILKEVLQRAMEKAHDVTLEKWKDATELGITDEIWDHYFQQKTLISLKDLLVLFAEPEDPEIGKSEFEKLVDLCSEDEALRNQVLDLEMCLQNNKDMLAATDILLDEQTELQKSELEKSKLELEQFRNQVKEVETLRNKVKNMESEHRLLKRDFDLVFATNKSLQKKMEKAELDNQALRKTIVALAGQLEKVEREHNEQQQEGKVNNNIGETPTVTMVTFPTNPAPMMNNQVYPQAEGQMMWDFNSNNNQNQMPPPHVVWDPAVRSLVPIYPPNEQRKKDPTRNVRKNKRWNDNNKGRLVSPFPRRYTSSHLPRYRRKYELSELARIQ